MSSAQGFLWALLATVVPASVFVAIGFTLIDAHAALGSSLIIGAGVLQFAWVVPMFRHAKKIQNEGMKIGLVVCASLVFLFCASCGGLLAALSTANFH